MNVTAQKFQSQYALVCKSLAWSNHRTTLPQSRPLGVPAPSEREPGGLHHSSCRPETATLRAIFIAPTKLRSFYIPPFNEVHSLSHALSGVPAPSEREPGTTKETRNQYEIS